VSDTDHGPFHSERGYAVYRDAPRTNGAGPNGQGAANGGDTNNRRTDDGQRANGSSTSNGQYWKRDSSGHSWDDPDWSILDDRRGELPDFPMDTLSDPCRGWVDRAAHGAGATPAHVAAPLLGTVASLIGTARRVSASRSWTQPMTTWAALVGLSGTSKTPGELAGLFLNMSRYSGGQDNEFWLEAWNGSAYTVERMGRPPVSVDYLLVGVVGGLQPDKLARSFKGDLDGMYARVLFSWPAEPPYLPLTNEVAEVEPEIVNALTRIINLVDEKEDTFAPRNISLSPKAVEVFELFRQFQHNEKKALDGREREWWAKSPAHVLRLAGTLSYLTWAWVGGAEPERIEVEFIDAAVRLVRDYFWPHSRAALRQIGLNERHANARRLLRWIRAHNRREISLKDARRDALGQSLDADETQELLNGLAKAGWFREITTPTDGRSKHRWEVNPLLFASNPESA
jgi:Protein of unknown function (DUF3987)